jgi:hypothetical protein
MSDPVLMELDQAELGLINHALMLLYVASMPDKNKILWNAHESSVVEKIVALGEKITAHMEEDNANTTDSGTAEGS